MPSRYFEGAGARPKKAHLTRSGGRSGEIADLRKDVEAGFTLLEALGVNWAVSAVATTTVTADKYQRVRYDASGGTLQINAPASPTLGDRFGIKEVAGDAALITISGNGVNIEEPSVGFGASFTIGQAFLGTEFEYDGTRWILVSTLSAGVGGGVLSVELVASLSSTIYFTAPGAAGVTAAGGENDFVVFLWHRLGVGLTSGVSAKIAGAAGAYEFIWNFGGLRAVVFDSIGTAFGPSNVGFGYGSILPLSEERDALIMLRLTGGAGTPNLEMRINGAQISSGAAANAGTPQTATGVLEVGGNTALPGGVEGMGYVSGILTDAQIINIQEASYAAGGLRDLDTPVMDWLWNSTTVPAASVWADQVGSDDMAETGVTTTISRLMKLA